MSPKASYHIILPATSTSPNCGRVHRFGYSPHRSEKQVTDLPASQAALLLRFSFLGPILWPSHSHLLISTTIDTDFNSFRILLLGYRSYQSEEQSSVTQVQTTQEGRTGAEHSSKKNRPHWLEEQRPLMHQKASSQPEQRLPITLEVISALRNPDNKDYKIKN